MMPNNNVCTGRGRLKPKKLRQEGGGSQSTLTYAAAHEKCVIFLKLDCTFCVLVVPTKPIGALETSRKAVNLAGI